MRHLVQQLERVLSAGGRAFLVTVVNSTGSTPRGAGAHMLVTAQGRIAGTIGGGAMERHSEQLAMERLETGACWVESVREQDLDMICGGEIQLSFHCLAGKEAIALARRVEELLDRRERSWLVLGLTEPGTLAVYSAQRGWFGAPAPQSLQERLPARPTQIAAEGQSFYCEPLVQPGRVYIFGGGHVAQKLVPALAAVDFRCVVLEDRLEYGQPALFPGAEEVRQIDYAQVLEAVKLTEDDYVVIMTRGHQDDLLIQSQVMRTPVRYIGVIGSRRKTQIITGKLREMGFADRDFRRVHAPIGLEIRSETPAEIAVSITAQLILERAGGAE